jgi:hypothetical protein
MAKHFLCIHTVFILNENINYLEEFIIYHKHLGFDHFYLYDNDGSVGRGYGNATRTRTKRGFPINTTNSESDEKMLKTILDKYENTITVIKWQPKNNKGQITYGWRDSVHHFISTYGKSVEWCAFIDLDEMIFSPSNINLPEFIRSQPVKVSKIVLSQKIFRDRFFKYTKNYTQDFTCVDKTIHFALKMIVKCEDIKLVKDMHNIYVNKSSVTAKPDILRFNHYKGGPVSLNFMTKFYKSVKPFELDSTDDGMIRYKDIFELV